MLSPAHFHRLPHSVFIILPCSRPKDKPFRYPPTPFRVRFQLLGARFSMQDTCLTCGMMRILSAHLPLGFGADASARTASG